MKKNLFILAVAGLALATCSSDETIASQATSQANEISFRPLVSGVTRAADIDANTGTYGLNTIGFTVFATLEGGTPTNYFPETVFTWASSSYTSSTKYYWPSEGTLEFFGYANSKPADHANQVTHSALTKAFTVTPDADAQYQTDLIVACTTGKSKTGTYNSSQYGKDGVPLNFRHAMTKVTIQLKNSSTDFHFTVGNVVLGNVYTTGTYTFTGSTNNAVTPTTNTNTDATSGYYLQYSDWSSQTTLGTYTQGASTTSYATSASAASLTHSMILVPQTLTNSSTYASASGSATFDASYITVQIKAQDASDHYIAGTSGSFVTALWPLPATKWLPGYHYTYTVDLAGGGYFTTNQDTNEDLDPILEGAEIKFVEVTVDGWNDQTAIDVPPVP